MIPSFKEAVKLPKGGAVKMDKYNLTAQSAMEIGRKQGLNPSSLYEWALKHDRDLLQDGHIYIKSKNHTDLMLDVLNDTTKNTDSLLKK